MFESNKDMESRLLPDKELQSSSPDLTCERYVIVLLFSYLSILIYTTGVDQYREEVVLDDSCFLPPHIDRNKIIANGNIEFIIPVIIMVIVPCVSLIFLRFI